jgi:putative SOS response-associated peptidase YedK
MPVILQKAQYNSWLDTSHFNRSQLESMLVPYTGPMSADPVSRYVNSPAHDDPGCLASQ